MDISYYGDHVTAFDLWRSNQGHAAFTETVQAEHVVNIEHR